MAILRVADTLIVDVRSAEQVFLNMIPAFRVVKAGETYLRWLDWILLGRYLPRLSINYVVMSKDMGKGYHNCIT